MCPSLSVAVCFSASRPSLSDSRSLSLSYLSSSLSLFLYWFLGKPRCLSAHPGGRPQVSVSSPAPRDGDAILQCWSWKPTETKLFCHGHTAIITWPNWGDLEPTAAGHWAWSLRPVRSVPALKEKLLSLLKVVWDPEGCGGFRLQVGFDS